MNSISITMQIAVIEAFRSEAIKPKEEFAWSIEERQVKECCFRLAKRSLGLFFFKAKSANSVTLRKKLNKNSANKRIVNESASMKRSFSQKCSS